MTPTTPAAALCDPSSGRRGVPPELAKKGITGARHEVPAGMEVNCARDLVLIFGDEIRAHVEAIAASRACPSPSKLPSI